MKTWVFIRFVLIKWHYTISTFDIYPWLCFVKVSWIITRKSKYLNLNYLLYTYTSIIYQYKTLNVIFNNLTKQYPWKTYKDPNIWKPTCLNLKGFSNRKFFFCYVASLKNHAKRSFCSQKFIIQIYFAFNTIYGRNLF